MLRREQNARAETEFALKRLAESEQRYRYMGETIPFGVWWCNPQGEAEYVSPSFCELTVGGTALGLPFQQASCAPAAAAVSASAYSRMTHAELRLTTVNLQQSVADALAMLDSDIRARNALVTVPPVTGNPATVVLLVNNFVSNALKFVPRDRQPQIHIGAEIRNGAEQESSASEISAAPRPPVSASSDTVPVSTPPPVSSSPSASDAEPEPPPSTLNSLARQSAASTTCSDCSKPVLVKARLTNSMSSGESSTNSIRSLARAIPIKNHAPLVQPKQPGRPPTAYQQHRDRGLERSAGGFKGALGSQLAGQKSQFFLSTG